MFCFVNLVILWLFSLLLRDLLRCPFIFYENSDAVQISGVGDTELEQNQFDSRKSAQSLWHYRTPSKHSNLIDAISHPISEIKEIMNSAQSAMSGEQLSEDLLKEENLNLQPKLHTYILDNMDDKAEETNLPHRSHLLEAYPNPFKDPAACHRYDLRESFICDPDEILGSNDLNLLETELAEIRRTCNHTCMAFDDKMSHEIWGNLDTSQQFTECRIAIALTQQLPAGVSGNTMAGHLLHRWGVGTPECQDGVLLLYVASENTPFIHCLRNVGERLHLNPRVQAALMPLLKFLFQRKSLQDALQRSVALLVMEQQGGVPPPRRLAQLLVLIGISLATSSFFLGCLIMQMTSLLNAAKKMMIQTRLSKATI